MPLFVLKIYDDKSTVDMRFLRHSADFAAVARHCVRNAAGDVDEWGQYLAEVVVARDDWTKYRTIQLSESDWSPLVHIPLPAFIQDILAVIFGFFAS